MTTVTIDVENKDDLAKLKTFLDSSGFKYELDNDYDKALAKSLKIALAQSDAGLGRPSEVVMAEMRAKYNL